ncbi:MAG: ribokinase [Prochlorothrix sp.]|nr:ribokinase [Prochlorothrix sp.]
MGIFVFGSLNLDLVVQAPHLPRSGETLTGTEFQTLPGGKGANQAVAAARLGITGAAQTGTGNGVELVGCVGADAWGQQLRENLTIAGVGTGGVSIEPAETTGLALITVATAADPQGRHRAGENHIVLVPGANARVGDREVQYLDRALCEIPGPHWVLLQLEVPIESLGRAAAVAQARGATVILDPAPVPAAAAGSRAPSGRLAELYPGVDVLTPNWGEAERLLGRSIDADASVEVFLDAARTLQDQTQVGTVILTLGDRGLVAVQADRHWVRPAFPVTVQDTTAAGDAFNGGLVVALSEGRSWEVALDWGRAAGALATTRLGAQSALPDRATLLRFLRGVSS